MNRLIKIFLLLLLAMDLAAQLTPVTDQYVLNPLLINPAFAGSRKAMNVGTFYRRQWVGIAGAPETMTITADAPLLSEKLGLGFLLINDKIGVTSETQFVSNYAYKINMGDGILSLGLGAGLIITNTAWSELYALQPGDDFYLIDSKRFVVPDFSFGVYYSYHNYFGGFSIPKFLSYKFDYNKNRYKLRNDPKYYTYMLNTGYLFTLSPKIKFLPSTLITYSEGERLLYDLNTYFGFVDKVWLGFSYRNGRSVTGLIQFKLSDQFRIAYSYDFDLGELSRYSNGSHGIMLRYELKYKVNVVNPLIF
jgi:type IX secretion system PorP/SprF family membrane protein